jgi:protein SCO1/2
MANMTRRSCFALAGLAPLAGVLLTQDRPKPMRRYAGGFRAGYFPNVLLRTQENREVRFYDDLLKDKIAVINFGYATCDGICTPITANLVRVQRLLGDRVGRDIFMYSITLKPEEDTPDVLKRYAERHGVGPGWLFLTGRPQDIELLRRKLGAVDPDPAVDADKSQHTGMIRYGNEALERWAACPGQADPRWIAKSILWVQGPKKEARS